MLFKYGFTFSIILLIFVLAGCGMGQPIREANRPNIKGYKDGGINWNATAPVQSSQESYRGFQWSIIDAQYIIVSDGYKLYYSSDGMESFETIIPNIDLKNLQQLDFVRNRECKIFGYKLLGYFVGHERC